ncbi:MAG: hypothetical protein JWP93_1544 [Polaromonas sp.]|nr:hypothetical protein [Polaromonas sp.]
MEKATNTANEKALGRSSEGSKKCATNVLDSTGINPAQLELKLEIKTDQPATKPRKYGLKSTATEAQYERVDRAFDYAGKLISTLDFRKMGVLHPAGRIKEMNEKLGYYIPTVDQRTVIDDQGYPHPRIAFYELIDRPAQGRCA